MGLFWDLIQESKLDKQSKRSASLETRVTQLETEIDQLRRLLGETLRRLERHVNSDLDGDGSIG
jgi:hypothetical protein